MTRSPSIASPSSSNSLSLAEARRIGLGAQGFDARRTAARSSWPRVAEVVDRLGMLQLDSVSVLVRAHYFPAFSRIGAYDRAALDAHAFAPTRRHFFEYWAHEASLLPLPLHPLMRWRMDQAKNLVGIYGGLAKFARDEKTFLKSVLAAVAERGPIAASDFEATERRTSSWWGWNRTKAALEFLFWTGAITAASRRAFERVYDLSERVLPAEILALPTPEPHDAIRGLAAFAGRALGVATETDIRDYFRLPVAEARRAVDELVEEGTLQRIDVETWRQPAFLAAGAEPRSAGSASALISPFDPLIWHRPRSERLFDLHYRIEIYVPAHKRQHGYYVLPFLHGGRFRARVDLKADRGAGLLSVKAAHLEPGFSAEPTAVALAAELRRVAAWLDLGTIHVTKQGGFATELARSF